MLVKANPGNRNKFYLIEFEIIWRNKGLKYRLGLQIVPGPQIVVKQIYSATNLIEGTLNYS